MGLRSKAFFFLWIHRTRKQTRTTRYPKKGLSSTQGQLRARENKPAHRSGAPVGWDGWESIVAAADDVFEQVGPQAGKTFGFIDWLAFLSGDIDAIRQAREGQALQKDLAGAGEGGEEETFAAKQGISEAFNKLDIKIDRSREGDQAAGIDAQFLAWSQLTLDNRAARVGKSPTGTHQALENKAFPAAEARAKLLRTGDFNFDVLGSTKERVLLAKDLVAEKRHVDGDDLARIWCGKGSTGFALPHVEE